MATNTPAQQLFDLLVSRDFDPELLDVKGMPATDPSEADIFNFDFRAESGKDYGTVVVLLGNDNNLEVYFGDNVGRTMEGNDKQEWFAFLEQLKHFAVKNFMEFSPKNINRLRYSMQGQAAIKEGLFESWTGTKTQSWNGNQTEARLMIKHKKSLGETDARFRYVESLFVETAEGERYKLPFTKLSGGRAMVEHVRNGGKPYDIRGQHIVQIVEELNILSRFRRANQGRLLEGDTAQLVEDTNAYYETAQRTLKSLSTNRGYTSYFESWNPAEVTEEEVVIEGLKHLFVTQSIDTRIEQALPLLARIQQQGKAMKEANIFEAWVERLAEGTWQLPDTPEKQQDLLELMSKEQPVGADATNITEQLYGLLGDDHLFDQLEELAERDANADARQVIFDRMQELSSHPDVLKVIEQLNIDPTAEMNPPEGTPADLSATPPEQTDQVPGGQGNINRLAEDAVRSIRRAAGLLTEAELNELNRRDFLKGAGAALGGAALAGIAGGAQAAGQAVSAPTAELGQWPYMMMWVYSIAKLEKANPSGMFNTTDIARAEQVSTDALHNFYSKLYDSNPNQRGPYNDMMREVGNEVRKSYQQITKGDTGEVGTIKKYIANADRLATKLNQYTAQTYGQGATLKENITLDETGSTIEHIKNTFKPEIEKFERTGNLDKHLFKALFDYYDDVMPYGAKTAEDLDPYEWVGDRLTHELGLTKANLSPWEKFKLRNDDARREAGMEPNDWSKHPNFDESVMHGDYAEEAREPHSVDGGMENPLIQDEGVVGQLPAPTEQFGDGEYKFNNDDKEAMDENDASLFDDKLCNMSDAGEHCPVHGVEECWANSAPESSPLAGQYGHTGKMKEVGKETSFLDRLKELSGMIRN